METVRPIVGRGLLLDVAAHRAVSELLPADGIGAEELEAIAEAEGISIRPGDCILVRTGWGRHWSDPGRYISARTGVPGPTGQACRWLSERQVALVGADTPTFEHFDPVAPALPGHLSLIVEHGIYIAENLNLEELSAERVYEFEFVCLPLKIVGGTGSPVRPIAIA
jgi:kynurenine formamidase